MALLNSKFVEDCFSLLTYLIDYYIQDSDYLCNKKYISRGSLSKTFHYKNIKIALYKPSTNLPKRHQVD